MSRSRWASASAILALITIVYLPVRHAGFVWDDLLNFQQMPWLRVGDQWKQIVFRGYNDWSYYFRPLIIAFFTLQIRLFNDAPGPMHLVSLGWHLINTALVGLVAYRLRLSYGHKESGTSSWVVPALPMLFFGLHPALVEAVVWVGCQFELALTLFVLLGLLANMEITSPFKRAVTVGTLFFFASLSKESAVCFPLLVLCQDVLLARGDHGSRLSDRIKSFARSRGLTYVSCIVAGLTYLALRQWALGHVNPLAVVGVEALANIQQACYLYLRYWLALLPTGLNPLHPDLPYAPGHLSPLTILVDAASMIAIVISLVTAVLRRSPWAIIVLAFSAAIMPALHLGTINFDSSTYHERYAMLAIASLAIFTPAAISDWATRLSSRVVTLSAIACAVWLGTSTLTIISVIPLWSSNLRLWEWALAVNPHSEDAKNMLLIAYDNAGRTGEARRLVDLIMADATPCDKCMVNIANFALDHGELALAGLALDKSQASKQIAYDRRIYHSYLFGRARWLLASGQQDDSRNFLQAAIESDPIDPQPYALLGELLRSEGKIAESNSYLQKSRELTLK